MSDHNSSQPPKLTKLEIFHLVGRGSELQYAWQHTYTSLLELKEAIDTSEDMADPNEPVEDGENDFASGLETVPVSPQVWLKLKMVSDKLTL